MANLISVSAKQIGTGLPLSSTTATGIAPGNIIQVAPTQDQNGGGVPYDRYVNSTVAAAVYSRIVVSNGIGQSPTYIFATDKVAEVITAANAALA